MYPKQVKIREVGPRDGFQAESKFIPTEKKLEIIGLLAVAGLKSIEYTSFVSSKAIPQLKDAADLTKMLDEMSGVSLSALVLNLKGVERAIAARGAVEEIQVVVSASSEHSRRNAGMRVEKAMAEAEKMASLAIKEGLKVRAAVACAFGSPFRDKVGLEEILPIVKHFQSLGIRDVTLGDTAGLGNPRQVEEMLLSLREKYPKLHFALHIHDTRGLGMANVLAALKTGVTTFEASIGGMGGCPFVPRASGNLPTEDVAYMFSEMGIETGLDMEKLLACSLKLEEILGHKLPSRQLNLRRC